jgi:hypothetical protein
LTLNQISRVEIDPAAFPSAHHQKSK